MIRRSWTQAASIEETLALWAASLREIKTRIRPLFRQERVAANAGLFLEGLLGDEQRKTGWMRVRRRRQVTRDRTESSTLPRTTNRSAANEKSAREYRHQTRIPSHARRAKIARRSWANVRRRLTSRFG